MLFVLLLLFYFTLLLLREILEVTCLCMYLKFHIHMYRYTIFQTTLGVIGAPVAYLSIQNNTTISSNKIERVFESSPMYVYVQLSLGKQACNKVTSLEYSSYTQPLQQRSMTAAQDILCESSCISLHSVMSSIILYLWRAFSKPILICICISCHTVWNDPLLYYAFFFF